MKISGDQFPYQRDCADLRSKRLNSSECCEEQAREKIQPFSENVATIFWRWEKVNGFPVSVFNEQSNPGGCAR